MPNSPDNSDHATASVFTAAARCGLFGEALRSSKIFKKPSGKIQKTKDGRWVKLPAETVKLARSARGFETPVFL